MICIFAAKAAVLSPSLRCLGKGEISVWLRHWCIRVFSSSIVSLTEGGGVYLFLRWWFVAVPAAWCQCWSSMAALRRCCDLPPFRLFSSRFVFQEPTFEASSTGLLGLCSCALWFDCSVVTGCSLDSNKLTVLRFPKTAFGDDARGSVWSADLVGIIGGSIRCFAHPSAVASTWLLTVVL